MADSEITRRALLASGAGAAAAVAARPVAAGAGVLSPRDGLAPPSLGQVPWGGPHQAGVTTAPPQFLLLAGFDMTAPRRRDLISLLRRWQAAIERLTSGGPVGPAVDLGAAPMDTGEAAGQGAANLTITIGFGPSLFDDRFGLAARRPAALADLPAFAGDSLDLARSGGDLSVQACAGSQLVVEHAIRDLARLGGGAVTQRWQRAGFNEPPSAPTSGTPRNLLGFKDGTANLDPTDDARMARNVWVSPTDGPAWMVGGTYQVYREVHLHLEQWDNSVLDEQQDTFGRYKASGAPYGGRNEFDAVDVSRLPADSHVVLANPRTGQASEDERILRRGFNFHDGFDPVTGTYKSGLAFIAYQRDPRRQFVTIQRRLAASDALNEYTIHTASGLFAIPPGVDHGDFVGSRLFT